MVQGENKTTYLPLVFRNREIRSFRICRTGKGWFISEHLQITNISIGNFLQDGNDENRGCTSQK
jgi:hypothetical protein